MESDLQSASDVTGVEMCFWSQCLIMRCFLRVGCGRDLCTIFVLTVFDPGPGDLEAMWAGMN